MLKASSSPALGTTLPSQLTVHGLEQAVWRQVMRLAFSEAYRLSKQSMSSHPTMYGKAHLWGADPGPGLSLSLFLEVPEV